MPIVTHSNRTRFARPQLQHGRLAMLATAGFVAQELVDGKGIIEHLGM